MRAILLVVLLFALWGCHRKEQPEYIVLVDKMMVEFSNEMLQEEKFYLTRYGGGLRHDIEMVCLGYRTKRRATVEEARELFIKYSQKLLQRINEDEKMRPFLNQYPFTANDIEFGLSFVQKNNRPFTDGSVAYVSVVRGNIYYYRYDGGKRDFVEILKEPYQDALQHVQCHER